MPVESGTSIALQRLPGAAMAEPEQLRSLANLRRYRREQDIDGQEERSDTWYRVVSGSARKYLMRADGRRQLVDIYLPGDLFGFTARLHHRFAVQAVSDGTMVASYARQRVEALAQEDSETALEIRMQILAAVERLQEQLLIVGAHRDHPDDAWLQHRSREASQLSKRCGARRQIRSIGGSD